MGININNPILAYRAWLIEQDAGWADTIVNAFENLTGMLSVSREIVDGLLTMEKFEEECQMKEDAEADKYDEEISDYVDGDDTKLFVDYLDKIIGLDDRVLVEPVALALLSVTSYLAYGWDHNNRPFDLIDSNQTKLFESLLEGDVETANLCENNISEEARNRTETKKLKESWDKFSAERFNIGVIKNYVIGDIFGI